MEESEHGAGSGRKGFEEANRVICFTKKLL